MANYSAEIEALIAKAQEASDKSLAAQISSLTGSYETQKAELKSLISSYKLHSKKDIETTNKTYDQAATDVSNYDLARGMLRSTNATNRYEGIEAERASTISDINATLTANINSINASLAALKKSYLQSIQEKKYQASADLLNKTSEYEQLKLKYLSSGSGSSTTAKAPSYTSGSSTSTSLSASVYDPSDKFAKAKLVKKAAKIERQKRTAYEEARRQKNMQDF